jgi:hypothetical protein
MPGCAYDALFGFPGDSKPFDDVRAGSVLLCFQKKTQATSKQDKAIAEARYRAVVNARKAQK